MRIINDLRLEDFWRRHADSKRALLAWSQVVRDATWKKHADMKATYPKADRVGRCYIFNIRGNNYRLITQIDFEDETVYVLRVLTHEDYDRETWKKDCC